MKLTKKDIIIFTIIFIFTIIVFNGFLTMHYATDTYNIINRGYEEYAMKYSLNDGRPVMCLISLFADLVNMPITTYIIILTFLAILVSCISIIILKKIVSQYKQPKNLRNEILLTIICYVTIFNFMFLENMQFAECFVMAISILIYLLAGYILTNKKRNYVIKAYLLLIIGCFFYQGTISFFIVIATVFSSIKANLKETWKNIFLAGIGSILACAINLIQIKTTGLLMNMEQSRISGVSNIITMIPIIILYIPLMISYTCNIFPQYFFFSFTAMIIGIHNIKKDKNNTNLYILIIVLISIVSSFALNLFTQSSFAAARLMFPIGSLIGNIYIILYVKTDDFGTKVINNILEAILIIYLLVIVVNYVYIINNHKKIENLNEEECNIINEYLEKYEKNNNIKLKNIAICYDTDPTYFYKEINNYSSLCQRPLAAYWSDDGSINYYTERNLKEIDIPLEVYEIYFKDKDWKELSEEQFIFIGDTVYYCVY